MSLTEGYDESVRVEWDGKGVGWRFEGLRWELNLSRIEIELVNGMGLEVN